MRINSTIKTIYKTNSKSCSTRTVPARNYYLPLEEMNKYYCVIASPVETQILCKNSTEPLELTTSGLLEIHENCRIQTENQTLRSHSVYKNIRTKIITPKFNLAQLLEPERTIKRTKIDSTNIFLRDHDLGLEEIAHDLSETRNKEEELLRNIARETEIKSIRWTMGSMAGLVALLTTSLTAFMIVKYYAKIITCFKWTTIRQEDEEDDVEMQQIENDTYATLERRIQTPYRSRRTM